MLETLACEGPLSAGALARLHGIPRPNVYRFLATLEGQGYCHRLPDSTEYVTASVWRGKGGLPAPAVRLVNAALPVLEERRGMIEWPLSIVCPEPPSMRILLSTDKGNARAITRFAPGRRVPLLQTTTGMLWLASLPARNRARQIRDLSATDQINRFWFGNVAMIERVVAKATAQGYLVNDSRYPEGSFGIPILDRGRVIGGITIRYVRAALEREAMLRSYLDPLRRMATEIAQRLREP